MSVIIDATMSEVESVIKYARYGANNCMIANSWEIKELVRCKDCKHGRPYIHTKEYVACEVDCEPIDRDSDFFCADGKRRSE